MKILTPLLCLLLACPLPLRAEEPKVLTGVVTSVHDGDTFKLGRQSIRIWGIDAPELKQRCGTSACGEMAQKMLSTLIYSQLLTCTVKGKSYNRIVAQCMIGKMDVAQFMMQAGMAFEAKKFSRGHYATFEEKARTERTGIWSQADVDSPDHWRACNTPNHKRPAHCG